jgi:hypothetical protein
MTLDADVEVNTHRKILIQLEGIANAPMIIIPHVSDIELATASTNIPMDDR